jgi:RNA polymerase sigma-70 factor, ECF subfamily
VADAAPDRISRGRPPSVFIGERMPEAPIPTGNATPDDESLVRLARAGGRAACEELFQRHRGIAFRVAYRLLGNEPDALDAVQDGLLKAFANLAEFDGRSGFRTWLVRVVSNAAIDLGRKRGRRATLGIGFGSADDHGGQNHRPMEPATDDDPARGLHRDDLRHALDAALDRLSSPIRTAFVLFAEAGLSYKEIAETQNVPIGTVMSRIHAARQKLQALLEDQGLIGSE